MIAHRSGDGDRFAEHHAKISIRITQRALTLLRHEAEKRYAVEGGRSSFGKILSELVEERYRKYWAEIERDGPYRKPA